MAWLVAASRSFLVMVAWSSMTTASTRYIVYCTDDARHMLFMALQLQYCAGNCTQSKLNGPASRLAFGKAL